ASSGVPLHPPPPPRMPNGGSVNQIVSSDFTTMSFGAFSGLPSNLSASTVVLPLFSVRVMRRVTECSQVTRRPCRSRVLPLAKLDGLRNTETLPSTSLYFMIRLLGMSPHNRYPPSGK